VACKKPNFVLNLKNRKTTLR